MHPFKLRHIMGIALAGLLLLASAAHAQVNLLWYKEVAKDFRIYVFNDPNVFTAWQGSGEMGKSITRIGFGPNGETVVFDNDAALDLYNFKHNKEAEVRPYTPPKAPSFPPPTTLKVADGELKFGLLLQAWYIMDDSAQAASGTSYLGNPTGVNDFRLRRAEIKLSGKVTPAWGYEVMIDPTKSPSVTAGADGKIIQDLGITFLGLKGHEFTLGQKKIAITEEGLRSSSEIDFIERARITRVIGDQRQAGFFYKGEYSEMFAAQASITNGLPSNVAGTSDRLFYAARFDVKPAKGMVAGISGGTGNQGAAALTRDRLGAHFRWDGTEDLPLMLRAEYGKATDGQTNGTEIDRDGYYVSGLYTFAKQFRLGARYEMYDQNADVPNDELSIITAGFHYMIKGKNINLKAEWYGITQDGRKVNNVLDETYNQFVIGAQVAF
ncbi:MAG TPA: porin [Thermoanaerobaculia bacterium]|nr:porin [Thermoanaerobaculia bacterium]